MFNSTYGTALVSQVTYISRSDRWSLSRRLQELMIPSYCAEDGSLWVEITSSDQAILLRSTVYHLVSSRQELIDWLERCFNS